MFPINGVGCLFFKAKFELSRVFFEIKEDIEEETFEKRLNEYVFEDTKSDSLFSNSEEDKKKYGKTQEWI